MSAVALPARRALDVGGRATVVRATVTLARLEALRMVRHPAMLLAVVWYSVGLTFGAPANAYSAYSAISSLVLFIVGPFGFLVAHLTASRDRRAGMTDLVSPAPLSERARTAALLLAVLGPVTVVCALIAVSWTALALWGPALVVQPALLEVAAQPLSMLGGGFLGVMVARWTHWTPAGTFVLVLLVLFHVAVSERSDDLPLLGAYVDWAIWTDIDWAGVRDGSRAWHLVYTAALCGMAACGALVATAGRKVALLCAGGAFTALTALAAVVQMP